MLVLNIDLNDFVVCDVNNFYYLDNYASAFHEHKYLLYGEVVDNHLLENRGMHFIDDSNTMLSKGKEFSSGYDIVIRERYRRCITAEIEGVVRNDDVRNDDKCKKLIDLYLRLENTRRRMLHDSLNHCSPAVVYFRHYLSDPCNMIKDAEYYRGFGGFVGICSVIFEAELAPLEKVLPVATYTDKEESEINDKKADKAFLVFFFTIFLFAAIGVFFEVK
jgi:hypothetical protein